MTNKKKNLGFEDYMYTKFEDYAFLKKAPIKFMFPANSTKDNAGLSVI